MGHSCGEQQGPPQRNLAGAVYSELLQQGSQPLCLHLAKTQRQAETWESFTVGDREASGVP